MGHSHHLRDIPGIDRAAAAAGDPVFEQGRVPHHEDALVHDVPPPVLRRVPGEGGLGPLEKLNDSGDADPHGPSFLRNGHGGTTPSGRVRVREVHAAWRDALAS